MSAASTLTKGWVLHRRPYRDTSLLIEVLTPEHGRLGLVARGFRGRRKQDSIEPLALYDMTVGLGAGHSDLGRLNGAQLLRRAGLAGEAALCGLYLNELLLRCLTRHDPHPQLHTHYAVALDALATARMPGPVLRRFELSLLAELGYGMELAVDANGAAIHAGTRYRWVPDHGLVPSTAGGDVSGATVLGLAAGAFDTPQIQREARTLLQQGLRPLLGDQPLRTPAMLRKLRQFGP